jgi:hypothetical protein
MSLDLGSYHSKDQADEENEDSGQQFHFSVVNRVDLVELKTERKTLAETSSLVQVTLHINIFERVKPIQTVLLH